MFVILLDNVFYSFWANKFKDEFIIATMNGLDLDANKVKLIYYEGLKGKNDMYFSISENNSLTTKEKIETINEIVNEETQEITFETVVSYNDLRTYEGVLYYENGNMLLPC